MSTWEVKGCMNFNFSYIAVYITNGHGISKQIALETLKELIMYIYIS